MKAYLYSLTKTPSRRFFRKAAICLLVLACLFCLPVAQVFAEKVPWMHASLQERLNAVRSYLEAEGYKAKAPTLVANPRPSDDGTLWIRSMTYRQDFVKFVQIQGERGTLTSECVEDTVMVLLFYPDWTDTRTACKVNEFPKVLGDYIAGHVKNWHKHSTNPESESVQRKDRKSAEGDTYELSQNYRRYGEGPIKGGYNRYDGSWDFSYRAPKENNIYGLLTHYELWGADLAADFPFGLRVMHMHQENTFLPPGLHGKFSEDLRKPELWRPFAAMARKVAILLYPDCELVSDTDAPADRFVRIEAAKSVLPADGMTKTPVVVRAYEKSPDGRQPLAGVEVSLKAVQVEGNIAGQLSADSIVTGPDGLASVEFTAGKPQEMSSQGKPMRHKVKILAENSEIGKDEVLVTIEEYSPLQVSASYGVMPALKGFENRISIKFGGPGELQIGKGEKAVVSVSSKGGRLSAKSLKSPGGETDGAAVETLEMTVEPGVENFLYYVWQGEQPQNSAIAEVLSVEIPASQMNQSVQFRVGIDLALTGGGPIYSGAMPGVFVPYKVYVHDRFDKDADLARIFADFGIEPRLLLRQTGYQPLSAMDAEEDFYTRLAGHIQGAVSPGECLVRDVLVGGVLKESDGGWLLIWKDYEGEGLKHDSLPGVIPWQRGTYHLELEFDPAWKGDAAAIDHKISLMPLIVEKGGKSDAHIESFIIPSLKSAVSMFPGGESGLLAVDVAVELQQSGDYKKAAFSVGRHFALDFIAGKVADSVQPFLESAIEKKVWQTARGQAVQQRLHAMIKAANEGVPGFAELSEEQIEACLKSGKEGLAGYIAGSLADSCKENAQPDIDTLTAFMKGLDDQVDLVLLEKTAAASAGVYLGDQALKAAPPQVFRQRSVDERLYESEKWLVVPVKKDEQLTLRLASSSADIQVLQTGSSLNAISKEAAGEIDGAQPELPKKVRIERH